ncbi:hypothetical protein E3N88_29500 [Mikania micrantha]|uniref:Cytochrome P450 n=1 Tax=Mikania micrantha TaxID=192012 RepID=A0A5N6ML38_9ASTR|nr:hypothetical protein E3N88_29500 [Mikania micrantha]
MDYIGSHFEFLPFGAGRRGCPGIKFAATINELVLANLAYKFEFALEGEHSLDMSETDGVTAHKKYPILVKATLFKMMVVVSSSKYGLQASILFNFELQGPSMASKRSNQSASAAWEEKWPSICVWVQE